MFMNIYIYIYINVYQCICFHIYVINVPMKYILMFTNVYVFISML